MQDEMKQLKFQNKSAIKLEEKEEIIEVQRVEIQKLKENQIELENQLRKLQISKNLLEKKNKELQKRN